MGKKKVKFKFKFKSSYSTSLGRKIPYKAYDNSHCKEINFLKRGTRNLNTITFHVIL